MSKLLLICVIFVSLLAIGCIGGGSSGSSISDNVVFCDFQLNKLTPEKISAAGFQGAIEFANWSTAFVDCPSMIQNVSCYKNPDVVAYVIQDKTYPNKPDCSIHYGFRYKKAGAETDNSLIIALDKYDIERAKSVFKEYYELNKELSTLGSTESGKTEVAKTDEVGDEYMVLVNTLDFRGKPIVSPTTFFRKGGWIISITMHDVGEGADLEHAKANSKVIAKLINDAV